MPLAVQRTPKPPHYWSLRGVTDPLTSPAMYFRSRLFQIILWGRRINLLHDTSTWDLGILFPMCKLTVRIQSSCETEQ